MLLVFAKVSVMNHLRPKRGHVGIEAVTSSVCPATTRLTLLELTFYSNQVWAKCRVFGDDGTVSEV
jgi:hypothetical protein